MKCRHVRQMIFQYMDDRLDGDAKKVFDLHLQNCAVCRQELEETQAIHIRFASAERFHAPHGFTARVLANLEEKEGSRRWSLLDLRPLFLRVAQVGFAIFIMTIGIISGKLLIVDITHPYAQMTAQEAFSIDLFQAVPPDSIGGIYAMFTRASHEK
jgi:predicted anti-sigma-YlaC factor YlaD